MATSTHNTLTDAIATITSEHPAAVDQPGLSACLDEPYRVLFDSDAAVAYLARHRRGDPDEPVDVQELTIDELLLTDLSEFIENCLDELTNTTGLMDADHVEEVLVEITDMQLADTALGVRRFAAEHGGLDGYTPEGAVDLRLRKAIERQRLHLTRLGLARAAGMKKTMEKVGTGHGVKKRVAEYLGVRVQSVFDALGVDDKRWKNLRGE
ncbi:hypothetical protein AB0M43_15700 [Longispora sp. NPDC051575]|uniref:hypothetical protein n=1 Tax=Longispora sp. NPDC051575 TaxID=3154943 RepID=UPI003442FB86